MCGWARVSDGAVQMTCEQTHKPDPSASTEPVTVRSLRHKARGTSKTVSPSVLFCVCNKSDHPAVGQGNPNTRGRNSRARPKIVWPAPS